MPAYDFHGLNTKDNRTVIRTDVWSQEMKDILQEELLADRLVRWIQDFPDGDTLHIPTLSELDVQPYKEGDEVNLQDVHTGDFTLKIDKYYQSGFKVYDKFKDDSFYINELVSNFVGKITRALMEKKETEVLALATSNSEKQVTINGGHHYLVGSGEGNSITLQDIARVKFALDRANVSKVGRIAVVDPAVSYQLVNIDNVIRQDVYGANTAIKEGLSGTIYVGRYMGFDFYESNLLSTCNKGAKVGGVDTAAPCAYNLFLGEEALIGAMRTTPEIESWRQHEFKSDAYHATIRYGMKIYRPESLVVIATNNNPY